MEKRPFKSKKSLGQNFLMHGKTAERIADAAGISAADTVFEIGPGTGQLTRALLKRAKRVIALEADASLVGELQKTFANEIEDGTLQLMHGDVRVFDPNTLPEGYVLAANIPYYLTGEIFRKFLSAENQPRSVTLLVQKEVAVRIAREKKESIVSLAVKAYGLPRYAFTVPRGAFVPAPNVDSAVLVIDDISRDNFPDAAAEERFFKLVHAGFAHKRKKLLKNLADEGFKDLEIPENARAEDLPLAAWLLLAHTSAI